MTPAELAVLIARLTGIAHEMGEVLRRGAFSPNIKERLAGAPIYPLTILAPEGQPLIARRT